MTTCPACTKTVDPLRSRFVGVIDGKVVAYCSAECAARSSPASASAASPARGPQPAVLTAPVAAVLTAPVAAAPAAAPLTSSKTPSTGVPIGSLGPPRPNTPAPGVPINLESGPVIEIIREPASGVVVAAGDERSEPRAKHPDEIPIAAFWSADKEKDQDKGDKGDKGKDKDKSGATRMAGPTTGPAVPPAADRDDAPGSRAGAASGHARAPSEPDVEPDIEPPSRSRIPLLLVILIVLGAIGFFAYQHLVKGTAAAATSMSPPGHIELVAPALPGSPARSPAAAPAPPAGAPSLDVDAVVAQARRVLAAGLTATSPRVQRVAAEALARTQDPAAREVLAAQLGLPAASAGAGVAANERSAPPPPAAAPAARSIETSDIAKLDLAYALARGGDKRGSDALAAALRSVRGEVRDEAARLLALLGDPRAVPHLLDLLEVSQRRLGAAEHLAHLAEPHALKVLEQLRGDARTSADDRTRATIALGLAGHADVAPALHDMLGDPHFNAFAAAALAELKDAAAGPVLEQQLSSPALRVRAARALRRLAPALDPRPVLPRLLDVLTTGRDTDQVQAAEAILLLTGPPAWSAFD